MTDYQLIALRQAIPSSIGPGYSLPLESSHHNAGIISSDAISLKCTIDSNMLKDPPFEFAGG